MQSTWPNSQLLHQVLLLLTIKECNKLDLFHLGPKPSTKGNMTNLLLKIKLFGSGRGIERHHLQCNWQGLLNWLESGMHWTFASHSSTNGYSRTAGMVQDKTDQWISVRNGVKSLKMQLPCPINIAQELLAKCTSTGWQGINNSLPSVSRRSGCVQKGRSHIDSKTSVSPSRVLNHFQALEGRWNRWEKHSKLEWRSKQRQGSKQCLQPTFHFKSNKIHACCGRMSSKRNMDQCKASQNMFMVNLVTTQCS